MGMAIGIDLGTTNSCAAIMQGGRPRLITYKGGKTTIPSVFAIDEKGNRLVGEDAKRQAQLNPTNTVANAKRLIGRNFHSKTIDKVRQVFTYELLEGESSEVLIKVKDQVFTLEQISAAILRKIKEVAEQSLGADVDQAVITVPAYFNDRQRQAVRNAGKLAGLKVLRILNEPTAAALAYGLGKNLSQLIAVYDLGGGTFDISVIDIKDRIFEVIATGGDTFLGGVDFDDRLMQYILEWFLEKHGVDLAWDRVAIQRIRDAAEAAKIELSSTKSARVHIPYIAKGANGPLDVDLEIPRDKLEQLTLDLIDRTVQTVARIFGEAGTEKVKIDEILLVGGQSRMPLIQSTITEFMGKSPCKGVNPDEAVAIGASIMAHSLGDSSGNDVTLLDVLPMPIGINRVDGTMHVLFQKNQPLPDYKTRTLTTSKDNQRSIMLRIYQGESRLVDENELLGTFVLSGLRQAPKGKVELEVTFHIDSEGILNLTARDKQTGQTVESTLKLGKANQPQPLKKQPPPPTPPAPLDMPQSSLARNIAPSEPPRPSSMPPRLTPAACRAPRRAMGWARPPRTPRPSSRRHRRPRRRSRADSSGGSRACSAGDGTRGHRDPRGTRSAAAIGERRLRRARDGQLRVEPLVDRRCASARSGSGAVDGARRPRDRRSRGALRVDRRCARGRDARARDHDAPAAMATEGGRARGGRGTIARRGDGRGALFGPEDTGLTSEDLRLADALVTIPTGGLESLNLAHAAVVLFRALFEASRRRGTAPASKGRQRSRGGSAKPRRGAVEEPPADVALRALVVEEALRAVQASGYVRGRSVEQIETTLFDLLGRAAPTEREARMIRGMVKRVAGR